MRRDEQGQLVPAGLRGTFGGVSHFVEAHSKEALIKAGDFSMHTVYVCGEAKIDVAAQVVSPTRTRSRAPQRTRARDTSRVHA